MSSSTPDAQVAQLRTELEYSAFLNKGVLQTNSEQKIRIAELESENRTLRIAESQLSRVEDELEEVQDTLQRSKTTWSEWKGKQSALVEKWKKEQKLLKEEIKKERLLRQEVERERDEWKARYESIKSVFKESTSRMIAYWEAVQSMEESEVSEHQNPAMPRSRSTPKMHQAATLPQKGSSEWPDPGSTSGPSRPLQVASSSSKSVKRRKRIHSEISDDVVDDDEEVVASPDLGPTTPLRSIPTPRRSGAKANVENSADANISSTRSNRRRPESLHPDVWHSLPRKEVEAMRRQGMILEDADMTQAQDTGGRHRKKGRRIESGGEIRVKSERPETPKLESDTGGHIEYDEDDESDPLAMD